MRRIIYIVITTFSITALDNNNTQQPAAMKNYGNTCFLNSAMQVFDNIPPLKAFFRDIYSEISEANSHENTLLDEVSTIQTFLHEPYYNNTIKHSCISVLREMQWLTNSHATQQDASELITYVMQQLEQSNAYNADLLKRLFYVANITTIEDPATNTCLNDPQVDKTCTMYIGSFSENDAPHEPTSIGSLLVSHTFSDESVEYTDATNTRHPDARKKHKITQLPEYLLIQPTLRYMTQEQQERMLYGYTPQSTLLNTTIDVPEVLQFRTEENGSSSDAIPLISSEHGKDEGIVSYLLNSCIAYSGNGSSGHYWAYVRKGDQWYTCNDSRISPYEFQPTWNIASGVTPYFLVYERINNEELRDYQERVEQRRSTPQEDEIVSANNTETETLVGNNTSYAHGIKYILTIFTLCFNCNW